MNPRKTPDPETLVQLGLQDLEFRNPILEEASEEEFQTWRRNPITAAFLLALAHRFQALNRDHALRWLNGHPVDAPLEMEARGRAAELYDICTTKLADLRVFYGKETGQGTESDRRR